MAEYSLRSDGQLYDALSYQEYYVYSGLLYLMVSFVIVSFYSVSGSWIVASLAVAALITAIFNFLLVIPENFPTISQLRTGYMINWSLIYRAIELIAMIRILLDGINHSLALRGGDGSDNSLRCSGEFDAWVRSQ